MDIGGDKEAECLHLPKEDNPFLGYRAVRISLERKDVILPQLRAILRAAVYGEIWVMFPMIAVKKELDGMLAALEEAKAQLTSEGIPFGKCTRVGMMAEVPSAVIMLDKLAKMVEFVSIGSNDLTQYTYAADRMNPRVSYLGDFLDPAVLRMIKRTIDVSRECGIDCSLCGEMAGDALGLAALVALGIHKVSGSSIRHTENEKAPESHGHGGSMRNGGIDDKCGGRNGSQNAPVESTPRGVRASITPTA